MPKWTELKRFCDRDGWSLVRQTDHFYYRKVMPDGVVKQTKVSMGTGEIPRPLWRSILKSQLQVSEAYFNEKI